MKRIGVLISGGGTNLQALIDKQGSVIKSGKIVCVLSNSANAYGLVRAKNSGIPTKVIRKNADCGGDIDELNRRICEYMKEMQVDVIVLAGYLSILGGELLDTYADRIINIHPSLIPSFCGDGYYGLKVHEEALKYGVKVTGATLHCWKRKGHGYQTYIQVVENSCNPGFVNLGLKLGKETLFNYIDLFGFGEKTGVDLNGESNGILFILQYAII